MGLRAIVEPAVQISQVETHQPELGRVSDFSRLCILYLLVDFLCYCGAQFLYNAFLILQLLYDFCPKSLCNQARLPALRPIW